MPIDMSRNKVVTTQMISAWIVRPGVKNVFMGVLEIDSVDIARKKFTVCGMSNTDGGDAVYSLPDSGFDIEIKYQEHGRRDDYEKSKQLSYATRCRVTERFTGPLATFDTDEIIKYYATIECDILVFNP